VEDELSEMMIHGECDAVGTLSSGGSPARGHRASISVQPKHNNTTGTYEVKLCIRTQADAVVLFGALAPAAYAGVPKQCSAMPECKGLQGDCCPNADGVALDCCVLAGVRIRAEDAAKEAAAAKKVADEAEAKAKAAIAAAEKTKAEAAEAQKEADAEAKEATYIQTHIKEAKCQNNAGCKKLGLVGFCCPNLDGTRLGCCGGATEMAEEVTAHSKMHVFLGAAVISAVVGGVFWKRSRNKVALQQFDMLG